MCEFLKDNEALEDLQYNNLMIIQEKDGYRFTSDAIALANFVNLKKGSSLVDLCSGSGVVGILAHYKNRARNTILVELQENLADMSFRTLQYNGTIDIQVVNANLKDIHKIIGIGCYDAIVCNPPYKKIGSTHKTNEKQTIAIAKHEITITLEEIVKEASTLLKFGGDFYTVNKEERLADLIVLCRKYNIEPKELKVLNNGKSSAKIFLLKAKKGGKGGMKISL